MTSGIIKRCLEECEESDYKFRIGAVIFSKKKIISSGHNAIRSSSIPDKYKVWHNSVHAEQSAVFGSSVPWSKLKGCSILVMKVSKKEKLLSNAEPCNECKQLLRHVGIKTVFHSDSNGQIVKLGL